MIMAVFEGKAIESRINTTLDFYSHVLPDMQREAIDRLDVMLS